SFFYAGKFRLFVFSGVMKLSADKKTVYIVFGKHTEEVARHLSRDFDVSGHERTLEAAVDSIEKLAKKPDVFLIAGTALVTGLSEGSINHGKVLLENLKKIRVVCPESRVKVVLSEKAGDEIVKGIVSLGIYDVHKTSNLPLASLPEIMNAQKTIADHLASVPAPELPEQGVLEQKVEVVIPEKRKSVRAGLSRRLKNLKPGGESQGEPPKTQGKKPVARRTGRLASILKTRKIRVGRQDASPQTAESEENLEPQKNESVLSDAYRDLLTGCFTRRFLLEKYGYDGKYTVVFIDLDKFKPVNDILGHEAGDRVLMAFGRMLNAGLKGRDLAVRWGGDEFVLILPETSEKAAGKVVENLRVEWERAAPDTGNLKVRFSAGVASGLGAASLPEVIKAADREMYKVKHVGKVVGQQVEAQPAAGPVYYPPLYNPHTQKETPVQLAGQVFRGVSIVIGVMILISSVIWATDFVLAVLGVKNPALNTAAVFVKEFWKTMFIGLFGST
ncbi:MAG: diguanylate cyclase, partial [Peptococcaceae bacterium]|nr:diguanylate cyclase [Peptococcaceae bacterium]